MKKKLLALLMLLVMMVGALAGCTPKETVISYVTAGGEVYSNVSDTWRLMMLSPVLVIEKDMEDEENKKELLGLQAKIREVIIGIVRGYTEETLRSPGVIDQLRQDILTALREDVGMDYLLDIWFNDFIIN